jgi:glycosyltransferase involved in cell wall biosynthesis
LEVVVVIDGPDSETAKALSDIGDSRLRWIVLSESGGANRARNAGVDAAMGKWIALLDDDDEWLPEKIERQMACVSESDQDIGVVSCRFIARSPMGDAIWPRRLPDPGETVGDYLFVRHSFFNGGAVLLTSTLLMPKELLYRTRFSETVKKHQEADMLLRANVAPLNIIVVPESLVIWYTDPSRAAITNTPNWRRSLEWIRSHRKRLSRRAYSGFVLVSLSAEASRERDWSAIGSILREAVSTGIPTWRHVLLFLAMWLLPKNARQWLRLRFRERALPTSEARSNSQFNY